MKHPYPAPLFAQRGLSIIELMIAMLIGSLIVFAVGSIALSNQSTFRSNQAVSDIQDIARTAFELMAQDVRQAGDDGCGNNTIAPLVANNNAWWAGSPTTGADPVWPGAVDIRDNLTGVLNSAPAVVDGSNVLILLGAGSLIRSVSQEVTSGADTIPVFPADNPFHAGQYVIVCDWNSAGQFAEVKSAVNGQVTLTENVTKAIARNGIISNYNAVAWYVSEDATNDNIPTLWRVTHDQNGPDTPVAILPGVSRMSVLAREDGSSDFVAYDTIADKSKIDAIQIDYTMVSLAKNTAIQADASVQNSEDRIQRQYLLVLPLNNRTKKVLTANPTPAP